MTWEQRITGCLVCIVLGFLISMGSTFRLIKLMKGDPMPFATMYTTGNLIGLASTCFLYGPWQQMKKMFASTRWWCVFAPCVTNDLYTFIMSRLFATGAYLFFMALTLFLAFYPYEIPLRLLWLVFSIFLQFLALIWYSLSFVPFARQIALQCMKKCCCAQLNSSEVNYIYCTYFI